MKKTLILMIILLLLLGCDNLLRNDDTPIQLSSEVNNILNIKLVSPSALLSTSSTTTAIDYWSESFFFPNHVNNIKYIGYISFDGDYVNISTVLHIVEKEELENLYELILDIIEGVPDDRLKLGLFFVDSNTIYRLQTPLAKNSNIDREYIIQNSDIVCSEQSIIDELENEDKGLHHGLEVSNNRCRSFFYNNQVETGFYEIFVWEFGKGLVEYKSGFGAERDSISITADF